MEGEQKFRGLGYIMSEFRAAGDHIYITKEELSSPGLGTPPMAMAVLANGPRSALPSLDWGRRGTKVVTFLGCPGAGC